MAIDGKAGSVLRYVRHAEARRRMGEVLVQLLDLVKETTCKVITQWVQPSQKPPGVKQGRDEGSCLWCFAELGVPEMQFMHAMFHVMCQQHQTTVSSERTERS